MDSVLKFGCRYEAALKIQGIIFLKESRCIPGKEAELLLSLRQCEDAHGVTYFSDNGRGQTLLSGSEPHMF
jgi:hypothetical protein